MILNSSDANVAQLVEQLIRNQQVTGSSPVISSNKRQTASAVCLLLAPFGRLEA